jgi:L-ascorbate metabolism protein UlaG (beta-lactamase superfamily)
MKMLLFFLLLINVSAGELPSAPFKDGKFANYDVGLHKGFLDVLKWKFFQNDKQPWPEWIEEPKGATPPLKVANKLRVSFINHASFLIQLENYNILTDPIWSERTSPVTWAGPKRVREAGINFDQIPKVDLVLISHNHYDHLDLATLKRLEKRDSPTIMAGKNTCKLLHEEGMKNCREYDWWQHSLYQSLKVTFVPARHFSGRSLFDRNEVLWGGFVIESSQYAPLYFAGDTCYGKFVEMLAQKFKVFDLCLLPIGAYLPRWFMKIVHMNPADAVKAHQELKCKQSIGMHFGTFQLTDEAIHTPAEDLKKALDEKGLSTKEFMVPKFGESFTF